MITLKLLTLGLLALVVVDVEAADNRNVTLQPFHNDNGVTLGPIGLGTPTQFMYMHLDTTSSSFFLVDANCKTTNCRRNRRGFDTKKSSTFKQVGYVPYFVDYNSSISTGYWATDCLTSLGIKGREPRVPFPFVNRPRGALAEAYGDGVFGISNELFSIFKALSYTLDEPVATFHMAFYNYSSAAGFRNAGQVTYGGNDDSCTNQYVYHRTAKSGEWVLNFKQVKFGNVELQTGNALVRLGPQKLYAPYAAYQKILSVLKAQPDSKTSEYYVKCSTINQLPPLEITVDSIHHKIQPNEYTVPSLDDRNKCIVLIAPTTAKVGSTPWVLGDVIARTHCVKFNVKEKTIGFGVPITTASSS